jgi:Ser/Thr protein kinase RdoA (MazF antagonist)
VAESEIPACVRAGWKELAGAVVEGAPAGLINQTVFVRVVQDRYVLQRVGAMFPAACHDNVRAVTEHLKRAGLRTPQLVPTASGLSCLDLGAAGVWRLMTFVEGGTWDVMQTGRQVHAAGVLLGRFHRAMESLTHTFLGLRGGVHDTSRHVEQMQAAIASHAGHRLHHEVAGLGTGMAEAFARLPPLPESSPRICHGDPKVSNIVFGSAGDTDGDTAPCFVDLDGVGPSRLAFELGDALRSWSNRSGEDNADAALDLDWLSGAMTGYTEGLGRALSEDEREAAVVGPEWISLELASRFARDALEEAYFGWDPTRFASRGDHNLVRCRGQLSLHRALVASRSRRAASLR